MPLCYYAKDEENLGFITVDTVFVNSYMSNCSEDELKVYLYGLYLCSMPLSKNNSMEHIVDALSIPKERIIEAFSNLQEQGLVTIFSYDPVQIQYHSPRNRSHFRTYKKEKYEDFNAQLEQYFPNKMILNPNQYTQYYDFIESSNIDPAVLLMIIKHCVDQKSTSVSVNYILQVARTWVNDGVRTVAAVEQRIIQRENNSGIMREIAAAIGKTSQISEEDKDFYIKWTDNWGFDKYAILAASKKSIKTMQKLDLVLDECFKNNAISASEIETYLKNKKKLLDYAIQIANSIGSWYDNPTPIVETYVSPWLQKGYTIDSLDIIAKYCFKNSLKKLEQMDGIVNDLYNNGIITDSQVKDFFAELQHTDEIIKELLTTLGISRIVTLSDRNTYSTWTKIWNFPSETISFVASSCVGGSFSDISKKLSVLKENNIFEEAPAKAFFENSKTTRASKKFNENDRNFDKAKLESSLIYDNDLNDIEM